MTAPDDAAALTAMLAETWGSIVSLCQGLTADQWDRPTFCPGWSVHDQLAHMVGTESMLAGQPAAEAAVGEAAHVRNDIGRRNEQWVVSLRAVAPDEVLDRFVRVTTERTAALSALTEAEWDAPSWTPTGPGTYRRFMQIRVFDCWVHEQDIRAALRRPGHAGGPSAERAIDEIEGALGYIVGKLAEAPEGSRVTIDLTGGVARRMHVAVDGRAVVVDGLDRPADATLRLDSLVFAGLACGRLDPTLAPIEFDGDAVLGKKIADHLAYTI